MGWRVAKSLIQLKSQIDAGYPLRNKSADGTIGDAAHSSRKSDHNPNASGIVCAIDITHDPANGLDAGAMAEAIRLSNDPRIKYIISNGRIANPDVSKGAWRKYTGKNPHSHHFHLSVRGDVDSERPWDLGSKIIKAPDATPQFMPNLVRGMVGAFVSSLQAILGITQDGDFGPKTEAAVKAFQKKNGLVVDGKVGPYTWAALRK